MIVPKPPSSMACGARRTRVRKNNSGGRVHRFRSHSAKRQARKCEEVREGPKQSRKEKSEVRSFAGGLSELRASSRSFADQFFFALEPAYRNGSSIDGSGSFIHSPSGGIIFDSCDSVSDGRGGGGSTFGFSSGLGAGGGGLPLRETDVLAAQLGVVEEQPAPVRQALLQQLWIDLDRLGDVGDRNVVIEVTQPRPAADDAAASACAGTRMCSNFCRRTRRCSSTTSGRVDLQVAERFGMPREARGEEARLADRAVEFGGWFVPRPGPPASGNRPPAAGRT